MLLLPRLPILERCYLSLAKEALRLPFHRPLGAALPSPSSHPSLTLPRERRGRSTRALLFEASLTYRLPSISYIRNITNRNGRARGRPRTRARARAHECRPRGQNEIAFAYGADCPVPRVKDLARPWQGPGARAAFDVALEAKRIGETEPRKKKKKASLHYHGDNFSNCV